MKKCEEIMKKYEGITFPYIDRGTWKNFQLIRLRRGGRVAKYEFGEGVGERKDMKHVNSKKTPENLSIISQKAFKNLLKIF